MKHDVYLEAKDAAAGVHMWWHQGTRMIIICRSWHGYSYDIAFFTPLHCRVVFVQHTAWLLPAVQRSKSMVHVAQQYSVKPISVWWCLENTR